MQMTDTSTHERLLAERARYVSNGVSTPRLVVTHAEGARVTDADGRVFLDFAGGIGCQNTGHRFAPVVDAVKAQADAYLHQCFMVGVYEPYIETCRLLAELSPCVGAEQKSILVNSGAEANENAVKIARAFTGRPAVIVFDNAFHGRTLLTMTMTSKVKPYKAGFGPFAPEVYRAPAPYPYRGVTSDEAIAGLRKLFKSEVDPETVACVVLEPVQGEGGFVDMPADYPARLLEVCREHGIVYVDDEVQSGVGRTGTMWAIEHYADCAPDLLVSGKSIGGGLPLAAVTGRAEIMDSVHVGGLGGTYGGNPVACAAAMGSIATMEELDLAGRAREIGAIMMDKLAALAEQYDVIAEVRGRGAMVAIEFAKPGTLEPLPDLPKAMAARCAQEGVVILTAGTYGNIIRLLPPLVISDELLAEGLDVLAAALAAEVGA